MTPPAPLPRCGWCGTDPDYVRYHDDEWGVPVRDGRALFEKLCLEAMQAGLSWITILKRREDLRQAFEGFDPARIAAWNDSMLEDVRARPGVIRHAGKIRAIRDNARTLLEAWSTLDEFAAAIWEHAPDPGRRNRRPSVPADVPTRSDESAALATMLRRRGWRFVGPISAYAFMQSMGLVDDHLDTCWRTG